MQEAAMPGLRAPGQSIWRAPDLSLRWWPVFLRNLLVPLLPRTWTLWLLRIGLIVAFVFHIHAAASLTLMNRRAHAEGRYVSPRDWQAANAASRSMRWTGVVILLFLIFHKKIMAGVARGCTKG